MQQPTYSTFDSRRPAQCDGRRFVRDFIDADTGETYAFEVGCGDWRIIHGDDDAGLHPWTRPPGKESF
jgi:hypothetical protein